MTGPLRLSGIVAVAALVLSACGGTTTSTRPADTPDTPPSMAAFDAAQSPTSEPTSLADPTIQDLLPPTPVTTAPPGAVRASILERQEAKLACLRRYGFDGEIAPDLGILTDVPPDQQERFFEVSASCREEVGAQFGLRFGTPTPEELTTSFRELLYVRACMIDEGYPVDPPPSLEQYVESQGAIWHPYTAFIEAGAGPTELQRLQEVCPDDSVYLRSVLDLDG